MKNILSITITAWLIICAYIPCAMSLARDTVTNLTHAPYVLLVDYNTSSVLMQRNAYKRMAPSSMSKLMTLYMAFHFLKNGKIKLDDKVLVSEKAWRMQGSKMFLNLGSSVSVEDLLRGIIVQSGNDASVALAEWIAGSESMFTNQINEMAKKIGLKNSHFKNATGLPTDGHFMTSADVVHLASKIIEDFPEYYHYFSETEFTHNKITQKNRNLLLGKHGVDGLKTGHADAAGYGLIFSAKQGQRRIIGVINGLASEKERATEATKVILCALNSFENLILFKAGSSVVSAPVWHGTLSEVSLTIEKDLEIVIPKMLSKDEIRAVAQYNDPLMAPLHSGQKVGVIKVYLNDKLDREVPLVVTSDVKPGGIFTIIIQNIGALWRSL